MGCSRASGARIRNSGSSSLYHCEQILTALVPSPLSEVCVLSCVTHVQLCDSMDYNLPGSSVHGDSAGKNTGMGCHALLQGIFPTQGLNSNPLCLLHWEAAFFSSSSLFSTTSATWEHKVLIMFISIIIFRVRGKLFQQALHLPCHLQK